MRKLACLVWSLFFTVTAFAQTDNWYVQTGVYEQKVGLNHFNSIGYPTYYAYDAFGFHRYFIGIFQSEAEAMEARNKADEMGFNSTVVSEAELSNTCRCNYIPIPRSLIGSLKNIFFDFDRSNLRSESKQQIQYLAKVLKDFPDYKTTFRAHTDAKGSNSYNEALSRRRANAAQKYLRSLGIASSRIKTETYGENTPIAKNELGDGRDTEEGRQFNRRVEIIILDEYGNAVNNMVDAIEVPNELEE